MALTLMHRPFRMGLDLAAQFLFCKSGDQVWDGSAGFMLR